ncbi:MAG: polyribonucleotide nucleotidyltransferase [candidate division Zixibacteria bacterium HGW-Zixibacteria-1]|nr:MAG: polyribonucleotide nucleotidyltransferase [candidate division Zixibacteria bacterium HGW-Zixibacteria-1]
MEQRVELEIGGKTLSIETGKVAKQANGAVMVRLADTVILSAVVSGDDPNDGRDFFPLTIDYREKTYAAGKIPGGFFKREGRPSEKEILSMRIIDRPIRPLFPEGFVNEVQCHNIVLSADQENDADILCLIGTSAALTISDIPFVKTIAGVRIGRIDGRLIINPTFKELEESDINITVAGSAGSITMVEGGGREISEAEMIEALAFGHEHIKMIVAKIEELRGLAGKPKIEFAPKTVDEGLKNKITEMANAKLNEYNRIADKDERRNLKHKLNDEIKEALAEEFPEMEGTIGNIIHDLDASIMREMIIKEGRRIDGRGPDEVRPITCEVGVLPRTHGSALFTRGQTQALVTLTLGTKIDEQRIDDLEGESTKSYMLHYNFPSFSVGEVRPIRGVSRREVGHGALAERALQPIIPVEGKFPYTIRIVSDILESNGSSSMASVCGGSLALMDGGVPTKTAVAGVAMGLIKDDDKVIILTDILGDEDHFGDMDFKVTGTDKGITAFQMDIKITGIDLNLMAQAMEKARQGRLHILGKMNEVISKNRDNLSSYAPRILTIKIPVEKIGEVIGPGGKMIRSIVEATGAKIDIEDDGTVMIASVDAAAGEKAKEMIESLTEEAEVNKVYMGTVRRITNFGAFIEILPGTDGLLHISEIDVGHVARVEDFFRLGDQVEVKVIAIDPEGKIRLSRKALLKDGARSK